MERIINKDNMGKMGVRDENGNILIPFKYDEITPIEDDGYFCRVLNDYDIYRSHDDGSLYINSTCRHPTIHYQKLEDGSIQEENDGIIEKYFDGKYGALSLDGKEILPCIYDEVSRWPDCDVIEVRSGLSIAYFNLDGKQILTKYKYPPVEPFIYPYTVSEQQNDIALMTMEFVDSCNDEQCCMCYGHPTRLDRVLRQDIEGELRAGKFYIPFPKDAFYRFNGWDTYIYRAYIVRSKSSNPVGDCIKQLREMRCYDSSWFYIDKVSTNSRTRLNDAELDLLRIAMESFDWAGGYNSTLGYGIDDDLADGEVCIFHIEYFADHWPSEEEMQNANDYVSIRPHEEDWKTIKKKLERHPNIDTAGRISDLCESISFFGKDHLDNYYLTIKWGLEHGWSPNEPYLGHNAIEHIDDCIKHKKEYHPDETSPEDFAKFEKIRRLLLSYGAKTFKETCMENPYYNPEDFIELD